jgi:hypothetical protein
MGRNHKGISFPRVRVLRPFNEDDINEKKWTTIAPCACEVCASLSKAIRWAAVSGNVDLSFIKGASTKGSESPNDGADPLNVQIVSSINRQVAGTQ